jgi:hypothetical protein
VKSAKEAMEILAAYDLTKSYRAAAELAGCSHRTVARLVEERDAADQPVAPRVQRPMLIDEFLPKLEAWVDDSRGKLRADVAHDTLAAMGFTGSERTARRAVAQVKRAYRPGHTRVHRPWIAEPGCGCSTTLATARRSTGSRQCCCARGWRGAATGW